ncbi:MAG: exo-alpha-sialidase [Chthonomonadetes bacterium]|nr:exo-alpha-sialidase [Chthonomonadetes bacterium]
MQEVKVPGVVINHSPASSRQYIGSPSLAVLPGGEYVASHDLFGPGTEENRTLVFASADRGRTWRLCVEIEGQFWSTLFVHCGHLYLMGTSRQEGFAVIRRSVDGGRTWTTPRDGRSGLLLDDARYHCAPVPVVVHRGRVWRAMEDTMGGGGWAKHFRTFMMSAPEYADLLNRENWTCSNRLARNADWLGGRFGGWLEGNAVVAPDGRIVNILRVDYRDHPERAAIVTISDDGRQALFDARTGFICFPGGCKKFTIRYDHISRLYWSLVNFVPERHRSYPVERARNTLALTCSRDLRQWEVRSILLYHPDPDKHAFQYVDWQFEGDDLIAVSRTAYDDGLGGAHNQHDANYLTFHRFSGFRQRNTGSDLPAST